MVDKNVRNGRVQKWLKLDSLIVKLRSVPQMKAFYLKIKLAYATQFENSLIVKNDQFCTNFCNHKLSPIFILLRAETGLLLMQVEGHIGSKYGRDIGCVASIPRAKMMKNNFYHEKQCL